MTPGLRIADHAGSTDVGRQRSTNEDSLVCSPPLFAVADGMGGAKAGEVASRLAADVLEEGLPAIEPVEAQLAQMVHEANRRIFELSTDDESRRGMGTTLTTAKLHEAGVSLAHVGDSRAYRMRGEELEQLTNDHSLVAELERSGQITAEAAEHHPQRSIITRVVGVEPDVEVDTYTVPAREGDVFLLCSDGLTGMISDDELASILRGAGSLQEAADTLVRAANQSGGKDNITVVLFRLGEDGELTQEPVAVAAPDETIAGGMTAADVGAAGASAQQAAQPRPHSPEPTAVEERPPPAARSRRARAALAARVLVGLLVVAAALGGLFLASRQVYFVGTNEAGLVTLYRGVPYELPLGLELYEEEYASGVPARAIPRARRPRVLDHSWRGREDAVDLVRQLERGRLDTGGGSS